jgi:hypothetical protein
VTCIITGILWGMYRCMVCGQNHFVGQSSSINQFLMSTLSKIMQNQVLKGSIFSFWPGCRCLFSVGVSRQSNLLKWYVYIGIKVNLPSCELWSILKIIIWDKWRDQPFGSLAMKNLIKKLKEKLRNKVQFFVPLTVDAFEGMQAWFWWLTWKISSFFQRHWSEFFDCDLVEMAIKIS